MSVFGVLITYACCWWLVLFMVLPWRVKLAEKPAAGLAASAPVNPLIRKKMIATTFLALVPTAMIYFAIGEAEAAEADIMSTKGGAKTDCVDYRPPADISANGGDATIKNANNPFGTMGDVHVGIDIPARDYAPDDGNPNLRRSDIYMGDVAIGQDGTAKYNGQSITDNPDCK